MDSVIYIEDRHEFEKEVMGRFPEVKLYLNEIIWLQDACGLSPILIKLPNDIREKVNQCLAPVQS